MVLPCCRGCPVVLRAVWLGGQIVAARGGPQAAANSAVHPVSQDQSVGRCRTTRRADVEMRAGMVMSLRRMVPLRALQRSVPVRAPTARERLKAIVASTSQAALAAKIPAGRWASALSFRSALTCSMMAWPRWVLSAVMVSRVLVLEDVLDRLPGIPEVELVVARLHLRMGCPRGCGEFRCTCYRCDVSRVTCRDGSFGCGCRNLIRLLFDRLRDDLRVNLGPAAGGNCRGYRRCWRRVSNRRGRCIRRGRRAR